jgi:hypothetical protein
MKLADQNNKKILVPRTGFKNSSEPELRYQKNDRDPGFRDPGIAIYNSSLRKILSMTNFHDFLVF